MLEEIEGELVQVRASGMGDLIKIVAMQFTQYCSLLQYVYQKHGCMPDGKVIEEGYPEFKSINIIAQTFTAMTVEAFYFDYYHGKSSKGKAESWSKQSPIKQFAQLSEEYLNEPAYETLDLYKKLSDLNKVRKRWVHNQSTQLGEYQKDLTYLSADGCVQLLREFFEYFFTRDLECIVAKFTFEALTTLQINQKGFSGKNKFS